MPSVKTCPFCHNPVKAGMALTTCPACDTSHHYACWRDQGGCAAPDCPENPKRLTQTTTPQPASTASTPPAPASDTVLELPALDPEVERLLAEIYLRLRLEQYAEVTTRLEQAKALAPEHPAVLEAEGDLAFARGKNRQAEALYGRAFNADPKNTLLEEKYATAVMKVHEPEILSHAFTVPDDSPWSNRVRRPVWASVTISILFPGFGQFYNGDWLKGLVVTGTGGIISYFLFWAIGAHMPRLEKGVFPTLEQLSAATMHWQPLLLTLLFAVLAVYAVIDAALVAKESQSIPELFMHDSTGKPALKP